jgi:hypothetical protein
MFTRSQARYTGQVPIIFTDLKTVRKPTNKNKKDKAANKNKKDNKMETGPIMTRSQTKIAVKSAAERMSVILYPLYDACAKAVGCVEEQNRVCIAIMEAVLSSPSDIPFLIRFCPPFASTMRAKCREFLAEPLATLLLRERCAQVLSIL